MNTATIIGAPVLLIAVGSIAGYVGYLHSEKYRELSVNSEMQSQLNLAKEYPLESSFSVTYIKGYSNRELFRIYERNRLSHFELQHLVQY